MAHDDASVAVDARAKAAKADAAAKAKADAAPKSGDEDYDPTTRVGYQEYPKVVHGPRGDVTVGSAEEEAEAMKAAKAPTK